MNEKSTRTSTMMKEKPFRTPQATDIEAKGSAPSSKMTTEQLDRESLLWFREFHRRVPLGNPHREKWAKLLSGKTDAEQLAILKQRGMLRIGRSGGRLWPPLCDWREEHEVVKK